jgi:small subunit ribosomal protein S6
VQPVPTYETIFITVPTLTDEEEETLVASLAQIVATEGGAMVARDRMGRRRLAYAINKFEDGVYTRFLYDSDAAAPKELERRIRLSDKVLRHLTVRLEPDWAAASKEQAIRDEKARIEAARAAAEAEALETQRAAEAARQEAGSEGAPPEGAPETVSETGGAEGAAPETDSEKRGAAE